MGILAGAVIGAGSLFYSGNANAEENIKQMDSECMSGIAISYEDVLINTGNDKEELVLTAILDNKNAQIYFTKDLKPYIGGGKNAKLLSYMIDKNTNTSFVVFNSHGKRYAAIINLKDINQTKVCKLEENSGIFVYNDRKYEVKPNGKTAAYNKISDEEAVNTEAREYEDEKDIKSESKEWVNTAAVPKPEIKVADSTPVDKDASKSAFTKTKVNDYKENIGGKGNIKKNVKKEKVKEDKKMPKIAQKDYSQQGREYTNAIDAGSGHIDGSSAEEIPVLDEEAPGCSLTNLIKSLFGGKEAVVAPSQDAGVKDAGVIDAAADVEKTPELQPISRECEVYGLTDYFVSKRNHIINEMYRGNKVLKYFKGDFAFSGVVKDGRFTRINVNSEKTTLEKGRKLRLEQILIKLKDLPSPEKQKDCRFDEIILRF